MLDSLPSRITGWFCAAAALAAFIYNVPVLLRSRRDPAVLALCGFFLSSTVSFLEQLNRVTATATLLPAYQRLAPLVTEIAVVGLTGAQTVFLTYWSHRPDAARPRARRRAAAWVGVAALLVVLNLALGLDGRRLVADRLSTADMRDPGYAAYLYLFFGVCAFGQLETARLSWRYMRIAQRSWLRRGMGAAMLGAVLSLGHCALRCWEITGALTGNAAALPSAPDWLTGDIGTVLKVFGWTVPAWGPSLGRAARWCAKYRSYLRLWPLWRALYRAVPDIVLDPPPLRHLGHLLPPRDLDYRLYRCVIEIRDGQRALLPYVPPDLGRHLGTLLPGPDAEACALAVALQEKRAGRVPGPSAAGPGAEGSGRSAGLQDDIAWLVRVADAFVRLRRRAGRLNHPGSPPR
ncbi:MAB_1171c family putative transporter [Streptomyces catenulae]|uniref:MAB_1171c family putative transporter n=1 Tax=Streptomyces catenulae TaxID=66875 RepID=A0ABV2YZB9_9ACTN|nr:MAB_1171c family putative transporter [Streptomyces catenulae]